MKLNYPLCLGLLILLLIVSGCGAETSAPTSAQASASPGSNTSRQIQNDAKSQGTNEKPRKEEAGFGPFDLSRTCYPPVTQERYKLLVDFSNTFSSELVRELNGYTGSHFTVYLELPSDTDRQINISIQRPGGRRLARGLVKFPSTFTDDTIMDFSQHSAIGIAGDIRKVSQGGILPPTPRIY